MVAEDINGKDIFLKKTGGAGGGEKGELQNAKLRRRHR